jgi:hypothetical protein
MQIITDRKDFPKDPHFAILEWDEYVDSGCWPDDPIKRYPYVRYILCDDEAEWQAEISRHTLDKKFSNDWLAIRGNAPAKINVSVNAE